MSGLAIFVSTPLRRKCGPGHGMQKYRLNYPISPSDKISPPVQLDADSFMM